MLVNKTANTLYIEANYIHYVSAIIQISGKTNQSIFQIKFEKPTFQRILAVKNVTYLILIILPIELLLPVIKNRLYSNYVRTQPVFIRMINLFPLVLE